jgi:hypothetical protein
MESPSPLLVKLLQIRSGDEGISGLFYNIDAEMCEGERGDQEALTGTITTRAGVDPTMDESGDR